MRQLFRSSFEAHRQFKTIHFILDRHILVHLVRSICYFYGTGLIGRQDITLLRDDILQMITNMEKIAENGCYDNGAQVHLYVSDIDLDKNCYNLRIKDQYICIIETYILNGVASTGKADYDRMQEWMLSLCRLSTMISLCGELQRIAFFNEQRSLLENLPGE